MAYAAVASLLQTIDILLTHHQPSISLEFKSQIISIHKHTCSLQMFIEGSSHRVNNWEETIREVTNRAEDIIELLLSDSLLESTVRSSRSETEEKYKAFYSLNELEKVAEEIESIVSRVMGRRRIETANGSDDEVMEIISRLRGGSSSLERIAICGGGGMGKSTLALKAYYHPLIVKHFDVRAGTLVTREYRWMRVIEDLMNSLKVVYSRSNSVDELTETLLKILGRKRFLIMVDDVWSFEVLERLSIMLPDYGNGSRILIITRSYDFAKSADYIHEMSLLDEDKSWNLIRDKVFKGDPCPFPLESTGKTIARRCAGHLLSITVVSGILATDQTEVAWEDVAENMKQIDSEDGDKVDGIIYLSYIYLPLRLRPCLLYLGFFPEGVQIYVSGLVEVWIAEGFVNESGYKSLEETGEEYVKELVRRSLVSTDTMKSNCSAIKSIKLHDLIRGMCIRQACIDNFGLHFRQVCTPRLEVDIIKSCSRLSTSNYCDDNFLTGVYGSTIRTLFFFLKYDKLDLRCWMGKVRLLRILGLIDVNDYSLSDEIFDLFHLRYLAFRRGLCIPEAISNLENLQTLIIRHENIGGVFDKLPEGIWKMRQLRHLRITCFMFPNRRGGPTSALENLRTLSKVVDFVCSREMLKMIQNLKKLALLYSNLRDVMEDYELHNLSYLPKLEILKIESNLPFGVAHKMSCAFPATLKELSLRGLKLPWEDMKIVGSLPNLEVLKLRNYACVGDTWETCEGGFPQLVFLRIEDSNLQNWITKGSHFPILTYVVLVRCFGLLEVPYNIPTLQLLELDDTNRSLIRSAERLRQVRDRSGHFQLQIREVHRSIKRVLG